MAANIAFNLNKKKKGHPQLIQLPEGGIALVRVVFGGVKPRVYDRSISTRVDGRTKEEVLAKIDLLRARVADQKPLLPHEYIE